MADPAPYVVGYSFGGFQSSNPSTPLPGPKVDNELANVAAAVTAIISALTSVRRSDGALKNQIVTFDSLETGLQLLVDPTNGQLVAAAVATAQAAAASASGFNTSAGVHDTAAAASAVAAAASAAGVNLTLYLAKANNLAGLGSLPTSRNNLGLGSAATFDVGVLATNIIQLNGSAKLPAVDGSLLTNIDVLPVGTTIYVNANAAPASFLKENGALVSRASFPRLYAFAAASGQIVAEASWTANSGSFSTGDLSTTFRLPDSRGEFIRGFDDSRGVDSGRVIGAFQADSLKDHTHGVTVNDFNGTGGIFGSSGGGGFGTHTVTSASPSTGAAAETRPRNVPKLACIKY